jgi:radical SAM protein with 4Fe4S-binding SPASM domain
MDPNLAKKIIDECAGNVEFISLQNMGESFLHPDVYELLTYAHNKGIKQRIVTNGLNIDVAKVVKTGVERIAFSVNAIDRKRYAKIRGDHWEEVFENIKNLWAIKNGHPEVEVHSEIYRETPEWQTSFENFWEKYCDVVTFSKLCEYPNISYVGENEEIIKIKDGAFNYRVCPEPFTSTLVKYNGDVVLCCVDDNHENVMGNANDRSLYEIWHGREYSKIRRYMYRAFIKDVQPCSHCPLMRVSRQENVRKEQNMTFALNG